VRKRGGNTLGNGERTRSRRACTCAARGPVSPWWAYGPLNLAAALMRIQRGKRSWKIMRLWNRVCLELALRTFRSPRFPRARTLPVARIDSGRETRRASAVMDFPDPDSPMMPSRLPIHLEADPSRSVRSEWRKRYSGFNREQLHLPCATSGSSNSRIRHPGS